MESEVFEYIVEESFKMLPERIRSRISNVAIFVELEPSDDIRTAHDLGEDESLLGHYHGIPLSERGETYGDLVLPDTVTIYMNPTLDEAEERLDENASDEEFFETVTRVVAETLWHEFAHHFGMNEDEVQEWERRKQ